MPRPKIVYTVHGTVGAYMSTKCRIVVFSKVINEMINLVNPEIWALEQG